MQKALNIWEKIFNAFIKIIISKFKYGREGLLYRSIFYKFDYMNIPMTTGSIFLPVLEEPSTSTSFRLTFAIAENFIL